MSRDRSEVRSPTSTDVRSPTRTSTWANTRGNFTSTVTGGAGAGRTSVTINIPGQPMNHWEALKHHHHKHNVGYMRGPSDAAGLADTVATEPATVKIAGGAAIGLIAGHFAGKHAIIGALIGAVGGYYYASQTSAAAPAKTS